MGHGARGLQRRRRPLELPYPRSRPQPRLSLGRGRHRRVLRRQAAAVHGRCAMERQGPDPEGADVRPEQPPGQPRRGRQGALLLSRCGADLQLRPHALQVSSGGVSLRPADPRECAARPAAARVRDHRDWPLRRRSLLRRRHRVCQGRRRGHSTAAHRQQSRPRSRGDPRVAAGLVPQHLELGRRLPKAVAQARRGPRRARARHARRLCPAVRPAGRDQVLRERDQHPAAVREPGDRPLIQGRPARLPGERQQASRRIRATAPRSQRSGGEPSPPAPARPCASG